VPFATPSFTKFIVSHLHCVKMFFTEFYENRMENVENKGKIFNTSLYHLYYSDFHEK
jgi:hypothetical protein